MVKIYSFLPLNQDSIINKGDDYNVNDNKPRTKLLEI